MPRHLALVPDGNRRWARERGLSAGDGHRAGIANVGRVAEAAWAAGVEVVTFWWGSPANLQLRAPGEVADIVASLGDWLANDGAALLERHGAAFEVIGRWRELAAGIGPGVVAATAAAGPGPKRLVCLMAYDGRDEILAAADRLGGSGGSREAFGRALWTGHLPPVDLLVRTGGEPHLSAGFLMWSIAEARLAFVEPLWPAFGTDDLAAALAGFRATERRFGR